MLPGGVLRLPLTCRHHRDDLVDLAREGGLTAAEAARALLGDDEPASVKYAGVVLRGLGAEGQLEHLPGPPRIGAGGRQPGRWVVPGEEVEGA